ncbi:MAG: hypothetical protein HYS13_08085 [Planctomycetia bacterium]|nr:hypothetical protein [Planctomycetia bacterium]
MSTATSPLDRLLDPVTDCFTPEVARRIVNLKVDPRVQSHLDSLADKANAGRLTAAERREYEEFVEAIDVVAILKAKARLSLKRNAS